jgi:hypothetical protein
MSNTLVETLLHCKSYRGSCGPQIYESASYGGALFRQCIRILSERHYWTEGWVHLILSAEILSDHDTSENGGLVHFSLEAGSIFTFWAKSYETYTIDSYDHVPRSLAI